MSVRGLNRSVVVYRRVEGLYKGSEKILEVLKEGIVGIGVQGLIKLRVGVLYRSIFASIILLVKLY